MICQIKQHGVREQGAERAEGDGGGAHPHLSLFLVQHTPHAAIRIGEFIPVGISGYLDENISLSGANAPVLPAVRVQPDAGIRPHQVQAGHNLLRALRRHGGRRMLLLQEEAATEQRRLGQSREHIFGGFPQEIT